MAIRKIVKHKEKCGHNLAEQICNNLRKAEVMVAAGDIEACFSLCDTIEKAIWACTKYGLFYENVSESARRLANIKRKMNILMIDSVRKHASSITTDKTNKSIQTKN